VPGDDQIDDLRDGAAVSRPHGMQAISSARLSPPRPDWRGRTPDPVWLQEAMPSRSVATVDYGNGSPVSDAEFSHLLDQAAKLEFQH
jgi:hypothetical protein